MQLLLICVLEQRKIPSSSLQTEKNFKWTIIKLVIYTVFHAISLRLKTLLYMRQKYETGFIKTNESAVNYEHTCT